MNQKIIFLKNCFKQYSIVRKRKERKKKAANQQDGVAGNGEEEEEEEGEELLLPLDDFDVLDEAELQDKTMTQHENTDLVLHNFLLGGTSRLAQTQSYHRSHRDTALAAAERRSAWLMERAMSALPGTDALSNRSTSTFRYGDF